MHKGLSVAVAAQQVFDGDESSVWAAIIDGSLRATALAESQHPRISSYDTAVSAPMARCFLAGDASFRFSEWRQYAPMRTGRAIAITTDGDQTTFTVRRATVVVAVPEIPQKILKGGDLDNAAAKREIERLSGEAPKIAPSIARYDGTYGAVTDEGYDAQNAQRWLLEAAALLQHLGANGAPVFGRLNGEFFKAEAERGHSRAILVHKTTLLLKSAAQLLDSAVGNLPRVSIADYMPRVESDADTSEAPRVVAEVAQPVELTPPEKVTILWLARHVAIQHWIAAAVFVGGAFVLGVQASRLAWVKEIFGL